MLPEDCFIDLKFIHEPMYESERYSTDEYYTAMLIEKAQR